MTWTFGGNKPPLRAKRRSPGPGPLTWLGARVRAHAFFRPLAPAGPGAGAIPPLATVRFIGPPGSRLGPRTRKR